MIWSGPCGAPVIRGILACALATVLVGCATIQAGPIDPAVSAHSFERRSLADPELREFLEAATDHHIEAWPVHTWNLRALTLAALYYRPEFKVAQARWHAAQARVTTAGARPNPVVDVIPQFTVDAARGVSPWVIMPSIDVPIETPGKREQRIRRARLLASASKLDMEMTAWQLRERIAETLITLDGERRRGEVLGEKQRVDQHLAEEIRARLEIGSAALGEVLDAKAAATKTAFDLMRARRAVEDAKRELARLVGVPVEGLAGDRFFLGNNSEDSSHDLDRQALRRLAVTHRADLMARLAEYDAARARLESALLGRYPNIHLGPGYEFDQGSNRWGLGFAIELPVFNRNEGPIAEAKAHCDEAAARFLVLQADVVSDLDRGFAHVARLRRELAQARALARLWAQRTEAMAAAHRAGAADSLALARIRSASIASRLSVIGAEMALRKAEARLETTLQARLGAAAGGWPPMISMVEGSR